LEREFSAGGVVIRKMRGRWFVAVIEPHMDRPKKAAKKSASPAKKDSHVITALPKGVIDDGEKPEQTALREVQEETGLNAEVISKLADIKYVYVRNWGNHARVFKIVSFYLLLYRSGKLDDITPEMRVEVKKAFWIPLDDAPKALSYKGEREIAERALVYVGEHPDLGDNAAEPAH
jgi:ADP-ribose pyrophosphatase YjhB (NUDIX family)